MMDDLDHLSRLRESLLQGVARRQRRMRGRRLALVATSLLVLFLLGMGVATGGITWRIWPAPEDLPEGVEPVALGPEKTIVQGTHEGRRTSVPWRLTAFESDMGLCVHVETLQWKGGGCGFGVPRDRAISYVAEDGGAMRFVYGPVDSRATRVDIRLGGGEVRSLEPIGTSAGFRVNFYLIKLPAGEDVVAVAAFDDNGMELGSITL